MPKRPPKHRPMGAQTLTKADYDRFYDNNKRKTDPLLALAKKIRSSGRWQKVRRMVMSRQPLCVDPFSFHKDEGRNVPTEHVHHIVGLTKNPNLAYKLSNLAGLCVGCHDRIEKLERSGKATQDLFAV